MSTRTVPHRSSSIRDSLVLRKVVRTIHGGVATWSRRAYTRKLTQVIDDFLTEYTADSLHALMHEGYCFDYLMTMLASEERRFPRLARVIDDTFRILERAVAWET